MPKNNHQRKKRSTVKVNFGSENFFNRMSNSLDNLTLSREKFLSLFRFNITFKLSLEFTLLFIGFILVLNIIVHFVGSYYFYFSENTEIKDMMDVIRTEFLYDHNIEMGSKFVVHESDSDYYIFDGKGRMLDTSSQEPMTISQLQQIPKYNVLRFNYPEYFLVYETLSVGGLGESDSSVDLQNQSDRTSITFVVVRGSEEAENSLSTLRLIFIIVSVAFILIVWTTANQISERHLKPIKVMNEKINDISSSNLSTRLDISGTKDELKDLASTFNSMINDIELGYDRQRQFVSDASHELRTPIAVIKGYGNMLKRWGKDDPEILEESIQAIIDETENMHSLVESLLFIARNDKNTLKMEKTRFNAGELIEDIVKETSMIDKTHEIRSDIQYHGEIFGAEDKLKQALRVFVDNSIKYTPDGGYIQISLRESEREILVTIKDNGIGISKEDLPKIFERFYRADKSRTKLGDSGKTGGTGLGLAIAKIIIDQHNGHLHVDSELNVGTNLTVIIPKNLQEEEVEE